MKIKHAGFRVGRKDDPRERKGQLAPLSLKDADVAADGTFSGYASVFGEVDSYGEVVKKGAFKASLKAWAKKDQLPRMLWMHRADTPIGIYTLMREDDRGLYVEGKLALDTQAGAEAYALLKLGALDGLSIGYIATQWTENTKTEIITLEVIDLWEVSLVTFPANDQARISGVKTAIFDDGRLPSLKEYEAFLREAGVSKSMATALASKGLAAILRQREAEKVEAVKLDDILSIIRRTP